MHSCHARSYWLHTLLVYGSALHLLWLLLGYTISHVKKVQFLETFRVSLTLVQFTAAKEDPAIPLDALCINALEY